MAQQFIQPEPASPRQRCGQLIGRVDLIQASGSMYRIVLACYGVPVAEGADAASDITAEFENHRTWWSRASCTWDGVRLILQADSDVDSDGLALLDEFSDCTAACIKELFDGEIKIVSITQGPAGA